MNEQIKIKQVEEISENLKETYSLCEKELITPKEAQKRINNTIELLEQILDNDSLLYREFLKIKKTGSGWWNSTIHGFVDKRNKENITPYINFTKKIINEIQPDFLKNKRSLKKEYFLSAGKHYEAKKTIFDIMKRASNELVIVDRYLDDTIFEYLDSLDLSIQIFILTDKPKTIFKTLYIPFAKRRGNIESRVYNQCHDRFIIIDNSEIFHLGASINHAGNKAFVIKKIENKDEIDKIIADFKLWWSNAQII